MTLIEMIKGKLQIRAGGMEESYGLEQLHLAVTSGYIANLMRNASIATWLRARYPDYFVQMERSAKAAESAKEPNRTMKLPYERKPKSVPAMVPSGRPKGYVTFIIDTDRKQ